MIEQHSDTARWKAKMLRCLSFAGDWKGPAYRFVTVPYSNRRDLLSGAGSRRHGGRWNPPNKFGVVYGSLTPEVALSESLGTFNGFGVPPENSRPRVFVVVLFRLQYVLDLTDSGVVTSLKLDGQQILKEVLKASQDAGREVLSQALGRIAWELKLEGIIIPTAMTADQRNIAVFPGRRLRGSSWKILGARDLPPKQ